MTSCNIVQLGQAPTLLWYTKIFSVIFCFPAFPDEYPLGVNTYQEITAESQYKPVYLFESEMFVTSQRYPIYLSKLYICCYHIWITNPSLKRYKIFEIEIVVYIMCHLLHFTKSDNNIVINIFFKFVTNYFMKTRKALKGVLHIVACQAHPALVNRSRI